MSNATHQVMDLLDIQVTAILIARSPEVDPEVNLKVGHLMGPAAPFLLMTESILVIGSMMETEVKTRTTDLIMDPTLLRTTTGTIPTMTGTVMTGFMTLTAGIMAGVMTGDMMTGVDNGLFPVGSHILQGLMTAAQSI